MRYIFSFLFLFPILLFSQTIDLRIPTTVGSADSLNGKPASYYIDTLTNQNIHGTKEFRGSIIFGNDLLPDSTDKRNFGSQTLRVKKLWLGNGIDMNGKLISLDGLDRGVNFDSKIHIKAENDTSGSICLHPGQYMPLVNTENGYRMWADSITDRPKWLLPNTDAGIKVNYTFLMLDTADRIGIGTTDIEAWSDSYGVIEFFRAAVISNKTDKDIYIIVNSYYDSGWKYKADGKASSYFQYNGTHTFSTAATGLENNSLTWSNVLVIDENGNVGISIDSPASKLEVAGDIEIPNSANGIILTAPDAGCWRVKIDNAGNLTTTSITCP